MTTITITRHHSGFANVADRYSIGRHDHDGDASVATYVLPDGYRYLEDQGVIVDPVDCVCDLVPAYTPRLPADKGAPTLVSLTPSVQAVVLQEVR